MSSLDMLKTLASDVKLTVSEVFDSLHEAGSQLNDGDREAENALEISIRLLEASRTGQAPSSCKEAIEFLAEECGLYPYVEAEAFSYLTQTVIQAHAVNLRGGVHLHAKQMQALLWLLAGDNVILSAPTSFGKTMLVDAFLSKSRPHSVVIIQPTIALIDESRRRLTSTFDGAYDIITTVNEPYDPTVATIFILTQERFLERRDIQKIDLLFIDEFYKLDPDRDDQRFETLNLALYRALPLAKQCFMAGPHVKSIDLGEHWRGNFRFFKTDYRTVTVNVFDRSDKGERLSAFLADLKSVGNENALVFTATPGSAQVLLGAMLERGVSYPAELTGPLSRWLQTNYHQDWPVAAGAMHGVAVHHGRIPRSLGQLFVQMFDKKNTQSLDLHVYADRGS